MPRRSRVPRIAFQDRLGCSVREAADVTSLSLSRIWQLMDQGVLIRRKIGRRRIIEVSSVLKLMRGEDTAVATPAKPMVIPAGGAAADQASAPVPPCA